MSQALLILAVSQIPVVAAFSYFYFRDLHGREPLWLLASSFALGACAVLPAALLEGLVLSPSHMSVQPSSSLAAAAQAVLGIALIEELLKFIAVRSVPYRSRHFSEPYDGIMYGVAVSLGFAALENLMYVLAFGVGTGVARMVTAIPVHTVCGVIMGFFLGLARFAPQSAIRLQLIAIFGATAVHGLYDYGVMVQLPAMHFLALLVLLSQLGLVGRAISMHHRFAPADVTESHLLFTPEAEKYLPDDHYLVRAPVAATALLSMALGLAVLDPSAAQQLPERFWGAPPWLLSPLLLGLGLFLFWAGRGIRRSEPRAFRHAFILFILMLPTPLFPLALIGLYGVIRAELAEPRKNI